MVQLDNDLVQVFLAGRWLLRHYRSAGSLPPPAADLAGGRGSRDQRRFSPKPGSSAPLSGLCVVRVLVSSPSCRLMGPLASDSSRRRPAARALWLVRRAGYGIVWSKTATRRQPTERWNARGNARRVAPKDARQWAYYARKERYHRASAKRASGTYTVALIFGIE